MIDDNITNQFASTLGLVLFVIAIVGAYVKNFGKR
jgi:hypothetical protein